MDPLPIPVAFPRLPAVVRSLVQRPTNLGERMCLFPLGLRFLFIPGGRTSGDAIPEGRTNDQEITILVPDIYRTVVFLPALVAVE